MAHVAAPITLMAFWLDHKDECRPVGDVVSEARAGTLQGVEALPSGFGFCVVDEKAALAAMKKENANAD